MGVLLCALLWGVVLLEEIERTPNDMWKKHGVRQIFSLRYTRKKIPFMLAFFVGSLFLAFEIYLIISGRSTFNAVQALGMFGILFGCYLFAVTKKGK